jgi:hypothetical protein
MAIGEADVFEIVMLAAGAHTFLRGGGFVVVALFEAEEDVLELVHSRVGEQQRWIVGGDERRRMHLAVTFLGKEVQEFPPNFRAREHERSILNHKRHRDRGGSQLQ